MNNFREISETKTNEKDFIFESIVSRITKEGGEVLEDETAPLYTESGTQQLEMGKERTVLFSLKNSEYMIIRKIQEQRLTGVGTNKGLEKLPSPISSIIFKKKDLKTGNWVIIDLESADLF